MPKPVSGEWIEDEFVGIARWGITHIVSLLEPAEAIEVGLETEQKMAEQQGMRFTSFPLPDRGLPASVAEFSRFAQSLHAGIQEGDSTVVHCRAGIGRAGIVAVGVLLHEGLNAEAAFDLVSKQRRVEVPDTPEQYQWILQHENQIRGETTSC